MFRRSPPCVQNGDDRKDLFGPVADLMVGVIFIFIILLIGLALHLQPEDYQKLLDKNALLENQNKRIEAENGRLKDFTRFVRDQQMNALFARIAAANETRAQMLEDLRGRLRPLGSEVKIDRKKGTLQRPSVGVFLVEQADPTH